MANAGFLKRGGKRMKHAGKFVRKVIGSACAFCCGVRWRQCFTCDLSTTDYWIRVSILDNQELICGFAFCFTKQIETEGDPEYETIALFAPPGAAETTSPPGYPIADGQMYGPTEDEAGAFCPSGDFPGCGGDCNCGHDERTYTDLFGTVHTCAACMIPTSYNVNGRGGDFYACADGGIFPCSFAFGFHPGFNSPPLYGEPNIDTEIEIEICRDMQSFNFAAATFIEPGATIVDPGANSGRYWRDLNFSESGPLDSALTGGTPTSSTIDAVATGHGHIPAAKAKSSDNGLQPDGHFCDPITTTPNCFPISWAALLPAA